MEELRTTGPQILKLFNVVFSVALSSPLTQHPCAVGPTFHLLRLALRHAAVVGGQERRQQPVCIRSLKLPNRLSSVSLISPDSAPMCTCCS